MQDNKIKLHQRFLEIFTEEELKDIIEHSMIVTEKYIIIQTEDNFFELSVNADGKLDIYCDANKNDTQIYLTKDEFMKLYKSSPLMEMQHINVDD